ncbi:two-component regulator propeller domain-containing protein [soil metagenome]
MICCVRFMLKCSIVFLLYFLCNAALLKSQDIKVKYLGIENGLSNNVITAMFQDHNGFMWFGTYDGLNRYDGYNFKVFRNIIGDSTSINSNAINTIGEDAKSRLWVGGQKEISVLNPLTQSFSTPRYLMDDGTLKQHIKDNVVAVKVINSTSVLIGTQHNGVFYFNNDFIARQVPLVIDGKKITDYYATAIEYDELKRRAYVFIENKGLFVYDLQKHSFTLKSNAIKSASCLMSDKNKGLWVGCIDGLYYYNEADNNYNKSVIPFKVPIVNLCYDKKGTLWIGSDGAGVWLLDAGKSQAFSLASLNKSGNTIINSNAVYALYIDKEERKWIGTLRGGVNIIEPPVNLFKTVIYAPFSNNSSVQNFILSFCEDANKNVWIGTDGAGLRYWNRNTNVYQNFVNNPGNPTSISSNFITGIINDRKNNIWISSWRGGIDRYINKTQSFQHYDCYKPGTKIIDNNVWFLFEDSKQRLWAGAVRSGGLYRLNNKDQFESFDSLPELQCIAEDAAGNLWAGNYSSLIRIDTLNKKHRYYDIGYTVRCIHEDAKKNFWVGTQEAGLLLFDRSTGTFKRYTTTDGLPSNTILRMLEDKAGNLWLSTYNGLSKFNVQQKTFLNFSQADGLQSNQFSYNAALALSDGEFLFGGIKGFNIFYPDSTKSTTQTQQIFLSSLKINNTPIEKQQSYVTETGSGEIKHITIPYNEASLSLEFLGLNYSNASDLNYAYSLQNWDKDWNYIKAAHTANYSRLQEGDYIFEVKISSSGTKWGAPQRLLYITILPPWYRTWWAYSLYVLLVAAVIYLYSIYKNRQTQMKVEVHLAHLETQKEKELNEKKIAFFTNVSHEFRTPLSLIINPIKDLLHKKENHTENRELKVIYRNAQRLLRLVDQLLLFKKSDSETDKLNIVKLNFSNLCTDVFSCFLEQARVRKIKYELLSSSTSLLLNADREKLEIALFNILSNAFKYTQDGGNITLKIEEEDHRIRVSISDTGAGIAESEGKKIFERFYQANNIGAKPGFGIGLYLVKNFVEAHGGTVFHESQRGTGTTFTILLIKNVTEPAKLGDADNDNILTGNLTDQETEGNPNHEVIPIVVSEQHLSPASFLNELNEEIDEEEETVTMPLVSGELASGMETLLIIDDDPEIRNYLVSIFTTRYKIFEASNGKDGIKLAHQHLPDLIISDIVMKGGDGLDLCKTLKQDSTVSHIPIILLTGTTSNEMQLKGMESGADDYIKKPFDKEILVLRVASILNRRNVLQRFFYNEITFGSATFKISDEYKEFLQKCMGIIESHLTDDQFSIKVLAAEMGMSHSNLYRKIKAVSGQSVNGFVRFIRLRKAAEIFINTENNVNETALMVGFNQIKYFRNQFFKLYGLNPSDYIKKYRKPFHNTLHVEDKMRK